MSEIKDEVKYFQREYNYLHAAGVEFAEKHSDIGGMLRLKDEKRKDPFVERLFEAFAFLSGRIHERLDDDIPEFAAGLLEQIFPQFLRPFPSCSILQTNPITGAITKPVLIKRGKKIQTRVGAYEVRYRVTSGPMQKGRTEEIREPTEFIFTTTQDCLVYPMKLRKVSIEATSDGKSALLLQFQPNRNVSYESLELNRFNIYINGRLDRKKYTLMLYLSKFVESLGVRELDKPNSPFFNIDSFTVGIPEIDFPLKEREKRNILPYHKQAFDGYRLLHEYFAYPDRFFFLEFRGLEKFPASGDGHAFEIRIKFDRVLSQEFFPKIQDLLINCVPIVNLFERDTEPVSINRRMPEYYIIPVANRRKSREIYSILEVTGVDRNKNERYKYCPITSFEMLDTVDLEYDYKRFYSVFCRPQKGDMGESYIRLFGPSLEQEDFPEEVLSIKAIMSNGFLPSKYLQPEHINQPVDFPEGVVAKNLEIPSDVLPNPDRQNFLWSLIAHLTVSFTTLADTDTLKSLLNLYNWSVIENNSNRKKIHEGILKVHPPTPKNIYRNRSLIRGIEFKIDIDPHKFENGEGDIHLFGLILNRFLSQYITINSFVLLTFIDVETKKRYSWKPYLGKISAV